MPATTPLSIKDYFSKIPKPTPGAPLGPVAPAPAQYGSIDYVSPTVPVRSLFGENAAGTADLAAPAPIVKKTAGNGGGGAPADTTAPTLDYSKYTNPATGQPYTAKEYADSIAKRAGGGVIPNYAGDALTGGQKTSDELIKTGRELNNNRNDVATGETDPYKIASKSGVQYTPAELKAIESAYAGVYDPAINDVFTKLDTKQKQDAADVTEKQKRADIVFNTNENIRQWRATTGSKASSGDSFTNTQEANGASTAGMTLSDFRKLDPDIKNFYINPPKTYDSENDKMVSILDQHAKDIAAIKDGSKTVQEVTDDINAGKDLPVAVKAVLISQLPDDKSNAKKGWWDTLFGG